MKKSIKVFASASVGNACCGFDVLGFAVENPGDIVTITLSPEPGVRIKLIGNDKIPTNPIKNTCGVAALNFLAKIAPSQGIDLILDKKMPIGSGLGSSAAGAAATLHGLNTIFDHPCSDTELLNFGLSAEKVACGAGHADNIAPSLFGGFILINSYEPLMIKKILPQHYLYCTIVHPDVVIKTAEARHILPLKIPMKTTVKQMGYLAGFISSLYSEDYAMMQNSLKDLLAQPYRSKLIPYFEKAMSALEKLGGIGGGISGSGPSIFALSKEKDKAEKISQAWQKIYKKIGCQVYVSKINSHGPKILKQE